MFVKQIKTSEPQAMVTIRKEAGFYHRVQTEPAYSPLAKLMPAMIHHEPARHALVLRLLPEAESLTEYQVRTNDYNRENAAKLARALAELHGFGLRMAQDAWLQPLFLRQVPWAMTLDQSGQGFFQSFGAIGTQLTTLLQNFPALVPQLCALRHEWQFEAVIHGDMKWENCLLQKTGNGDTALRIVDWELVDLGDGAWDVATVFKEYLVLTIMSAGTPVEKTLDDLRPAIREFWKTYAMARQFTPAQTAAFRDRAIRFTAARMLVAVLEYLHAAPQASAAAMSMLNTSAGILSAPQAAAAEILGYPQ
jgi:thiamine kinase-like enzyme